MKTNTDQLIHNLTVGLKPYSPFRERSSLLWSLGILFLTAFVFAVLVPQRADYAGRYSSSRFLFECLGWLGVAFCSLVSFIRSGYPAKTRGISGRLNIAFAALIAAVLISRFVAYSVSIPTELDWTRGRCGPTIFLTGLLASFALGALSKKLAPTEPVKTACWIALASGAFASFLMEFVCGYESGWHIVIWHMMPVALLCWLGAILGQKALRW